MEIEYHYGVENINQDPSTFVFKEGREVGWLFDVIEPIVVTKLMFFNDTEQPINRTVKLYRDVRNIKEMMYFEDIMIDSNSWGFSDTEDKNVILEKGRYAVTGKVVNAGGCHYVPSEFVDFGQVGIKYVCGLMQNIKDIGWLTTNNVYLMSFEYTLK